MDSVIICATKDGLLLLEDTGADLFQSKYHRPADNINNENSPSVVAYQNYIYYSTGDSILRVLQIIDQDTIVDVASIQLPLPIKHIKRYDNNLLVSGQIEWGQNMFVAVLELSNPEDPTITFMQDIDMPWGGWLHPSFVRDLALYNDTLIVLARHVSDSGNDFARVFIYELSDDIEGIPIDTLSVYSPNVSFTFIEIKDHYAFIPATRDSLAIYDLSNTNFLQVVNTIYMEDPAIPGPTEINESKLIVNKYHTLFVYDITFPQEPELLYSVNGNLYGTTKDVDFYGQNVIVTLNKDGLWIYEIEDDGQTRTVFPNPLALDIDVSGDEAFIAAKFGGVAFLDISNIDNPNVMQVFNTNANAREILKHENYLYTCDDWGDLDIFDISNSDSILHTEYDLGYSVWSLLIRDNYAYVGGYRGFSVLDLIEPWNPQIIGEDSYPSNEVLFANDSLVFTDSYYYGYVLVFDVSSPEEPYVMTSIPVNGRENAVGFESYIYTTSEDSQLVVIDATDPLDPISYYIDSLYFNRMVDAVKLGDTLIVSDGNLHALLVEDPINPVLLTSCSSNNTTGRIDFEYPYIYTADKGYMRIYKYDSTSQIVGDDIGLSKQFKIISCYPNPFNAQVTIQYEIPYQTDLGATVYDILGRRIWLSETSQHPPGYFTQTWDGIDSHGADVSSGIYIIQLSTPDWNATEKIILLK